ncbi:MULTISPECIES: hypothetical protein [unclassified Mesorhizobium]|uniref:hypothetical protein n=1 Tax=unclassified Mesorhizobium TaxID=325217 RepID=UPI0015E286B3|nr:MULTISPECIES: hypothetical protein [unclassified Mesorhizobium]
MDVETVSAVADQLSDIGASVRSRDPVDLISDLRAFYFQVIQAPSRAAQQAKPERWSPP